MYKVFLRSCLWTAFSILIVSHSYGSNPDMTPLMEAAENGQTAVVNQLISKGANVNAKTREDGVTALMCAAFKNHFDIVKILIDKGADVNATTTNDKPVLYFAAGGNNTRIIDMLIQKGAGNKIQGVISQIDKNIMYERQGFGFGLTFRLKEYPDKLFFMRKDLATKYGIINPQNNPRQQFEPMSLRIAPGNKIELVYFDIKNEKYSQVVQAKL